MRRTRPKSRTCFPKIFYRPFLIIHGASGLFLDAAATRVFRSCGWNRLNSRNERKNISTFKRPRTIAEARKCVCVLSFIQSKYSFLFSFRVDVSLLFSIPWRVVFELEMKLLLSNYYFISKSSRKKHSPRICGAETLPRREE